MTAVKIKGPFFFFYAEEWRGGVAHLSAEERGVYIDLISAMWKRKGGLPDDPKWIARDIGLDTRLVKRVIVSLIAKGKLRRVDGFLQNKKIMEEIAKYLSRGRGENDQQNTVHHNECDTHCDAAEEELSDSYPTAKADLENLPLFSQGNPDQEVRSQKLEGRKKDSQLVTTVEQDAACVRAGFSPEDVILDQVRDWFGDDTRARLWVTTHVGLYGLPLVRDGIAVVVSEIASGKQVTQPVQLVASVIRRLDAKRPEPPEREREPGTIPPWVADKSVVGKRHSDVLQEFYRQKAARLAAEGQEVAA